MVTSHSEIRVTDLTLAAFLSGRGHKGTLTRIGESPKGHPLAAWDFASSKEVENLVAEFQAGEARVEPTRFRQDLTTTRRELYGFLGIG